MTKKGTKRRTPTLEAPRVRNAAATERAQSTRNAASDPSVLRRKMASLKRELREALDRETATSEVLRVISRSPTDARPSFDLIAHSAARLCDAQVCHVFRFDGKTLHFVANHGLSAKAIDAVNRAWPRVPDRTSMA